MAAIQQTLQAHAARIARLRREAGSDSPLPVGLWIPASAAGELLADGAAEAFARWLTDHDLTPLTINGFPYDNFHLPVVKHRVYRPAWWQSSRLEYTAQLAELLDRMLPADGRVGSISTLPLGWPGDDGQDLSAAGANLRDLASRLQRLEARRGRRVVVAIEPEPGCLLDRCEDVVAFFESELPDANHRRYLGVCHDVCHSAVMFESQSAALKTYARAGIEVGKIQISSAIDLPLADYSPAKRQSAIDELKRFAEDRYLHQTGLLDAAGQFRLVEDLPQWLATVDDPAAITDRHLRIHFHVPVYREQLGHLRSTRDAISECVTAMRAVDAPAFTGHYEIETYAWTVLPDAITAGALTPETLSDGIARELAWFESVFGSSGKN